MAKHKTVQIEKTIGEMLNDAASELNALREEMESWRDGMEDKLSATQKFEDVSSAADELSETDALEDIASRIEENLTLLAEGRAVVISCDVHTIGLYCAQCGWNGVGQPDTRAHVTIEKALRPLGSDRGLLVIGRIGRTVGTYFCIPNPEHKRESNDHGDVKIFADQAEARMALVRTQDQLAAKYPPIAPKLRAAVTALAPLEGADKRLAGKIVFTAAQAYKGKHLSRATRCSAAVGEARTALEALTAWLDEQDGGDGGEAQELSEEHQSIIDDIRNDISEYEGVIDSCEGVDFPGMY